MLTYLILILPRCTEFFPQILHVEAVSKDGGRVLPTVCDMSSVHCLMQIFTAFFFIFWCLHASIYVTSEKPSNDKPSLKDLESLFDSKLKPIHSRLARRKPTDLQQICNRSVLRKTD